MMETLPSQTQIPPNLPDQSQIPEMQDVQSEVQKESTRKVIEFYSHREEPYGCFSNFSPHAIWIKDIKWPTSEHYFQAQKFENSKLQAKIQFAKTPGRAAEIGRNRSNPLRKDWEEVKDEIMFQAVLAKFTQHTSLRKILLGTEDAYICEHTAKDSYWGDGGDGSGKNMLGQILMRVRDVLKNNEQKNQTTVSAPPSVSNDSEKIDSKRLKNRKGRAVYLAEDGTSLFEKDNNAPGEVTVVGQGINISHKALSTPAKIVVHRNQWRRKYQTNEEDLQELEEDESEETNGSKKHSQTKVVLGEFIQNSKTSKKNSKQRNHKSNSQSNQAYFEDDEEKEEKENSEQTILDPIECINRGNETLTLLTQMEANDPLVLEFKEQISPLQKDISTILSNSPSLSEETTNQLLDLNDRLSQIK